MASLYSLNASAWFPSLSTSAAIEESRIAFYYIIHVDVINEKQYHSYGNRLTSSVVLFTTAGGSGLLNKIEKNTCMSCAIKLIYFTFSLILKTKMTA